MILTNPFFSADLDEGRTLYKVLKMLPDDARIKWLDWCCNQASIGSPMRYRVMRIPESTKQYLVNLYQMLNQGQLTLTKAVAYAELLAKTRT